MIQEAVKYFVEPLSKATGESLERLDLKETDRLHIAFTKDGNKFHLLLHSGTPDQWPPCSYAARSLFYRIPEKTYHRGIDNECDAAITDTTVVIIYHSFDLDKITFENDDVKMCFFVLLTRFCDQFERVKDAAEFKQNKVPQDIGPEHSKWPLEDYQKAAVKFAMSSSISALFLDKGLGKTACAVRCIDMRAKANEGKMLRVLVCAPAQVLLNWKEEIAKFTITSGKVTICRGNKFKRVQQFAEALVPEPDCMFTVLVASYDTISACGDILGMSEWDLLILDESQHVKDSGTKRFKALRVLREKCTFKLLLTATPIGNSPMDLWSQFEILGEGISGFSTFGAFRSVYGVWEQVPGQNGIAKLVGLKNMPLLQERISRLAFTLTKNEAGLKLPEKVYDIYEIEMTSDQSKAYAKLRDELSIEFQDKITGEIGLMEANHVLTALLRLAQITSGFVTTSAVENEDGTVVSPKKIRQIDPTNNPKINAVVELLTEEDRDEFSKTIIWACFREDIKSISEKLKEKGIKHDTYYGSTSTAERDRIVYDYNNDDSLRCIVCNPQTAGEGLNLLGYNPTEPEKSRCYTGHEIFFSQNWSGLLRSQAEDRAHRRGTRMPVRITDLVVPDTIDEEIRRRVTNKIEVANSVTDLRETLSNILR